MGNYTMNYSGKYRLWKNRKRTEKILSKLSKNMKKYDIDLNIIDNYINKDEKYFYIDGEGSKEIVAYFKNRRHSYLLIKDVNEKKYKIHPYRIVKDAQY